MVESIIENLNVVQKVGPYLAYLPRTLPILNGKVASQECRDQGKTVSKKAKKDTKKEYKDTKEVVNDLKVLCELEKKCFMEYVDALKPLMDSKIAAFLTKEFNHDQLKNFALPVYDYVCAREDTRDEL